MPCGHYAKASESFCELPLDGNGDHAVCCEKGPWRVRRHDAIADFLVKVFQAAGCTAVREFPFAEFRIDEREAILDLWASGSVWMADRIIDVTVRHPCKHDIVQSASKADAACSLDAEREKQQRYPPAGGLLVTTFAAETFGRLGPEAEHVLAEAAAAARRRNVSRGHPAGRQLDSWRATLSALVAKAVTRAVRAAMRDTQHPPAASCEV